MSVFHRLRFCLTVSEPKNKRKEKNMAMPCWSFFYWLFHMVLAYWSSVSDMWSERFCLSACFTDPLKINTLDWAELMAHLPLVAHFCFGLMAWPCMYQLERGKKDLITNKNSGFRFKFFSLYYEVQEGKVKGCHLLWPLNRIRAVNASRSAPHPWIQCFICLRKKALHTFLLNLSSTSRYKQ